MRRKNNRREEGERKPGTKQKLEYLFYEVSLTCKGLFVIAELRNVFSDINRRPKHLESLAQSVCKMCLHPEDSDPS